MKRRTLFKLGIAGGAVLAVGGGLLAFVRPGWRDGRLTPAGRALFAAVAGAVLEGLLPQAGPERNNVLDAHLARVEATIVGMPPRTQAEIAQMLGLIGHPVGRRALVGLAADWADAHPAEVQQALQGLRASDSATRQQIYAALRDITCGAFFSDRFAWALIGYPGPREL